MPYINVKIPQELSPDAAARLRDELGQAICLIPGKNESALMIALEDGEKMLFGGAAIGNEAFFDVRVYGKCELDDKRAFTEKLYEIMTRLFGTDPARMFVNFTEYDNWGARGSLK